MLRHGLIRPSFIPPREIRELRDLTRYRKKLLGNGAAERNRIQKILEDANIKLGSVLTDVFGVSGQRMLHALVESELIDVEQVAELAHWSLKPKMDSLKKALEGQLTPHHRFMIEISLEHMEHIEKQILRLDEQIAKHLVPVPERVRTVTNHPRHCRNRCGIGSG